MRLNVCPHFSSYRYQAVLFYGQHVYKLSAARQKSRELLFPLHCADCAKQAERCGKWASTLASNLIAVADGPVARAKSLTRLAFIARTCKPDLGELCHHLRHFKTAGGLQNNQSWFQFLQSFHQAGNTCIIIVYSKCFFLLVYCDVQPAFETSIPTKISTLTFFMSAPFRPALAMDTASSDLSTVRAMFIRARRSLLRDGSRRPNDNRSAVPVLID